MHFDNNCNMADSDNKSLQLHVNFTHLSLMFLLWGKGKQYSPRWDAAKRYSVCIKTFDAAAF